MDSIILNNIIKQENKIVYDFEVSFGLQKYFSGKIFQIEYPENIESVPDAVLAIPFVCNVLPIIWLTNSNLYLDELDKDFYECIPEVRHGYEVMFPESEFAGCVNVGAIINCNQVDLNGSASFFSGGIDAVHTLVSHIEEKPMLVSIWGADIKYDNVDGWNKVYTGIQESVELFHLPSIVIRSSFREFDNESILHNKFSKQLKDGWWHGVKHGIGLLGHMAPISFLKKLKKIYIASSYCPSDGVVRCASSPLTDNKVRFNGVEVKHDGFECSRQDKAHDIVEYVNKTNTSVNLHVCWESQKGGNCCSCEKCYRTMSNFLAEGEFPSKYGFNQAVFTIPQMRVNLLTSPQFTQFNARSQWTHIQKRIKENKKNLKYKSYWKDIKWITKADFEHIERIKLPFEFRVRRYLSKFAFYQKLHLIKGKLNG